MQQFLAVKKEYPEGILFFRMGDFYEMFFEDAVVAAKALDLTLTSRDKGKKDSIPMCGLPHHAARAYVAKLTSLGHRVVICEQTEDPKKAKGLVKREVVQVVTPGVVIDEESLDPSHGRYLVSLILDEAKGRFGLASLDVSTGEFRATELLGESDLDGELARILPNEILFESAQSDLAAMKRLRKRYPQAVYTEVSAIAEREAEILVLEVAGSSMVKLGIQGKPWITRAAASALKFARSTQPTGVLPIVRLLVYFGSDTVFLDEAAVTNLELCRTMSDAKAGGALISVLDATRTALGSRLLRRWMLYPSPDPAVIIERQDALQIFFDDALSRTSLRDLLREIYDLERLAGRVSLGVATPYDIGQLKRSLKALPGIEALVRESKASARRGDAEKNASLEFDFNRADLLDVKPEALSDLSELCEYLEQSLLDDLPRIVKNGGFIREGFCSLVDEERALSQGGQKAVSEVEERERERLGIPLKVKYNRVFGYHIEVTRSYLAKVPDDYVRKQTVANAERYVTDELKKLEVKITMAQEKLVGREQEILADVLAKVASHVPAIQSICTWLARLDALSGLALVAHEQNYCRPTVDASLIIDIKGGRHPVVERSVGAAAFVPNDCRLDCDNQQLHLITGPNMAGKSTYMRQNAQIVLMAQMGSFVPAESARIGVVDRIFTRVGASDNVARGDSTFMVEMRETSNILKHATRRSLVILDEVGRGTSTYDGVSIAWAVSEYLHDAIGARTLFATHYHELLELSDLHERVVNAAVMVKEEHGEIVFLRRVVPGGCDRSYGIEVAKLAGLPGSVIARANQILRGLEQGKSEPSEQVAARAIAVESSDHDIRHKQLSDSLKEMDINSMTPLQALTTLANLRDAAERN